LLESNSLIWSFDFTKLLKNKHDPRNYAKPHEIDALIRITSCQFVDRFTASYSPSASGSYDNLPGIW